MRCRGQDMQVYAREQIKASTGQDIERHQPQVGASLLLFPDGRGSVTTRVVRWTRPLNFVFHGGSGSEKHHIATVPASATAPTQPDLASS